jgi:hypothetical protein
MEKFTIDADFESAAAGRNQFRFDAGRIANFSRQTDGFRFVVSNRAILDADVGLHFILLEFTVASTQTMGQAREALCKTR